jgi:hypothetical protein
VKIQPQWVVTPEKQTNNKQFVAYYYRMHTVIIFAITDLQPLILHEMWLFGLSLHQMSRAGLQ